MLTAWSNLIPNSAGNKIKDVCSNGGWWCSTSSLLLFWLESSILILVMVQGLLVESELKMVDLQLYFITVIIVIISIDSSVLVFCLFQNYLIQKHRRYTFNSAWVNKKHSTIHI